MIERHVFVDQFKHRCIATVFALLGSMLQARAEPLREWALNADRYGGGIVSIITNDTLATQQISVLSSLSGRCVENPSWTNTLLADGRLGHSASAVLVPRAWFAKWSLFSVEDAGCEVRTHLAHGKEVVTMQKRDLRIPAHVRRPGNLQATKGAFDVLTTVIEDKLLTNYEPSGTTLQLQVLVRNRSDKERVVAILRRNLVCNQKNYDWSLGAGSAPTEIAFGPVTVAPDGWSAFSQRISGGGDPSSCVASVAVSELLSTEKSEIPEHYATPPIWREIIVLKTSLKPVVTVTYQY